jgi:hypothetical protein
MKTSYNIGRAAVAVYRIWLLNKRTVITYVKQGWKISPTLPLYTVGDGDGW